MADMVLGERLLGTWTFRGDKPYTGRPIDYLSGGVIVQPIFGRKPETLRVESTLTLASPESSPGVPVIQLEITMVARRDGKKIGGMPIDFSTILEHFRPAGRTLKFLGRAWINPESPGNPGSHS